MTFQPHPSESKEIPAGVRDPEYADPLPPHIPTDGSGETRTEWPMFTIVLAVVMVMVVTLSTPWAARVRNFLFPPHQTTALEYPPTSTVTSLPEPTQPEPIDGTPTAVLVPHDRPADAESGTNGRQGEPLPATPDADKMQESSRTAFVLLVNGQEKIVGPGETLSIARSDQLVIQDFQSKDQEAQAIKVNFAGFVGNKMTNDAEDRGYTISPPLLLKRHSVDKKGRTYRIEATSAGSRVAEMFIRIEGD